MDIQNDSVVSIDYTLKGDAGDVIDSSEGREPLFYLHGHGQIVPGLEEALVGKRENDEVSVSVPAEKGYGPRDPQRVFQVPRDKMPADLELEAGVMLQMQTPDGGAVPLLVTEVLPDAVTVDANHMLAGATLHFQVTVRGVREATAAELSHGHVHGPGGSHD
ncbi:MAG: peptidylprolyl isomerase [Myxococcales bacterium]|nr:peptidylprolyl isomerase [Myxococcales bacterium]